MTEPSNSKSDVATRATLTQADALSIPRTLGVEIHILALSDDEAISISEDILDAIGGDL